jgi:hypothetical protein
MKHPRVHQATAGHDTRLVNRRTCTPPGTPPEESRSCGFIDVRRACHRWLMGRDEVYRRDHLAHAARQANRTLSTQ